MVNDRQLTAKEHNMLLEQDRRLYASLLYLPNIGDENSMAIMTRLLAVTEINGQPIPKVQKRQEDQLIAKVLPFIKPAKAVKGLLELVKLKVNNQRTSRWIRRYVLAYPQLEKLAVAHRKALATLLRHALGKQVAQTCVYFLKRTEKTERENKYLNKNLFKFKEDNTSEFISEIYLFLFNELEKATLPVVGNYLGVKENLQHAEGLPRQVVKGLKNTYHNKMSKRMVYRLSASKKEKRSYTFGGDVTVESGVLVGHIQKHFVHGFNELNIQEAIEAEAAQIPNWDAKVCVIADRSYSMVGFGSRAYNNAAVELAITKVLGKVTAQLIEIPVGNKKDQQYPKANGVTNLGDALIRAFELKADCVLLISDGYENQEKGDALHILEAIRGMDNATPVIHILPVYTNREAVAHRRPLGEKVPLVMETGQRGVFPLWMQLQFMLQPDKATDILVDSVQAILN